MWNSYLLYRILRYSSVKPSSRVWKKCVILLYFGYTCDVYPEEFQNWVAVSNNWSKTRVNENIVRLLLYRSSEIIFKNQQRNECIPKQKIIVIFVVNVDTCSIQDYIDCIMDHYRSIVIWSYYKSFKWSNFDFVKPRGRQYEIYTGYKMFFALCYFDTVFVYFIHYRNEW